MPGTEIINIIITVAIAQAGVDLLANRMVFKKDPYQRSVSAYERARTKRDKILAQPAPTASTNATRTTAKKGGGGNSSAAVEKHAKKIQRAEDDLGDAAADVARRHTTPTFFGSMLFLIIYRILSIEYSGKVIAVLPFQPWKLVQRLSMRGLELEKFVAERNVDGSYQPIASHTQACSFMFIYFLCTFSVKFIVHRFLGTNPPHGADGGMGTILDAPKSRKFMESIGVDTEELKEARKAF
uniref:Calcium load-activated calcium channel n=1 Tax=Helicotheca tamesis TaxID=374047 RepID=A0A7S2I334_9STRA|mmetsp:Transcript_4839/g.6605  ORF Transcript_4839/g.6605 Transcript_4839/m.6605 type:complete len:240 (+) Transcript_4839:134-853(+)|eukprot:CAMPEP_0185728644 /NCGR_PEP_ID=MMETSP1171-20130828/3997_1 /TAXON_ID=374046 /ORGANISM="Helicotheca tamensis, Strain CCMP826" /LENGTH=239 /DNA_ID=CAMNT_0028397371 /DNA_START=91 /DNA_END=810 /DNA_ORIENTATION=-